MSSDGAENPASKFLVLKRGGLPSPASAEELQQLLFEQPGRLSALRSAARSLMRQARFEDALACWARISQLAAQDIEAHMAMARIHERADRAVEALNCLQDVLRRSPQHTAACKLHTKIAHRQTAKISAVLTASNAKQYAEAILELQDQLEGDISFERLKLYHALLLEETSEFGQNRQGRSFEPTQYFKKVRGRGVSPKDNLAPEAIEDKLSLEQLDELEHESADGKETNLALTKSLANYHARKGNVDGALGAYRCLSQESTPAHIWLDAANFAVVMRQDEAVEEFCRRAVSALDADKFVFEAVLSLLEQIGAHDAAIELSRASSHSQGDLAACQRVVRIFFERGRDSELIEEVHGAFVSYSPFSSLREGQQPALVEIVRLFRKSIWRTRRVEDAARLLAMVEKQNDDGAIGSWVLAMLASACLELSAAIANFKRCFGYESRMRDLRIDLDGEIALVYERLHRFGEASLALRRSANFSKLSGYYKTPLQRVQKIVDFCGWREDLCYPECLIDVIFEEIAVAPLSYRPEPRHLLTVSSSLRTGGSERQTVTVLRKMAYDSRLERIALTLRATDHGEGASFLQDARELPIQLLSFGENWDHRSDLLKELPQLTGRDRLISAIDLLPHNFREDIIRTCARILNDRPQAVHLRQDLFAAAIGCALAGVPRFAIHRGSLSPDHWRHGELATNLFLRPMRHTYRHLLSLPSFAMINNSVAGATSDREWTTWPDARKFRVIYNAIEFDRLDREASIHVDLREKLGIPKDAFVVGGIFRVEAVKRPMLWIEAASLVASARPSVHFIVLGDGSMASQMREYARSAGFLDRLHMPGLVSNVAEWFSIIDLNLLTSEREGLPNVLIEGQHFGVPAVSADVGGALETIEPGKTGRLVAAHGDAGAFAEVILEIASDHAWRQAARGHAPAFVHAKFGIQRTVDELLDCLGIRAK